MPALVVLPGRTRYSLPPGPKIINAYTVNIRRNVTDGTDAHPMYIVRYKGQAHFCRGFKALGHHPSLEAVCGALNPIPTVTPNGVERDNPVVAYLVTNDALEIETCECGVTTVNLH